MKNLSIQQINEIYKELAYTIMTEKEFLKIVKNITEKEKEPSIIIEKIREYILKIIDKDSNILEILNEIINTKFKNINEYNTALKALEYICDLSNKYNINLEVETINNLLTSNETFNTIVSIIVNKNLQAIKKGNISKLFKREEINEIIEIYCIINEIEEEKVLLENIPDSLTQYINEIIQIPLLTKEEEISLLERAKNGDEEAKNKLIEANQRLVIHVAQKYQNSITNMELGDLIQEGYFGLKEAIERFNIDKKCKFSTYAYWWIRQKITRAISNKERIIRLPVYLVGKIKDLHNTIYKLTVKLNREPTEEEIAREMNLSIDGVRKIKKYAQDSMSLDITVGEDGSSCIGDFIEDGKSNIEDEAINNKKREKIFEYLNKLSERYREVIMMRYGFEGEPKTFQEIGKSLGITRQRAEQIEKKVLRMITTMIKEDGQEEFLNDNYTYKRTQ